MINEKKYCKTTNLNYSWPYSLTINFLQKKTDLIYGEIELTRISYDIKNDNLKIPWKIPDEKI